MNVCFRGILAAMLATLMAGPATTQAQEKDKPQAEQQQRHVEVRVTRAEEDEDQEEGFTVEVRKAAPSKYWIGVLCEPIESELVKSQLGIGFGLVLEEVIEKGPSAKAGLKKFDILTKVDGKALDGLPMLGQCIAKSDGEPLELTVIRQGKPLQITITPAERPKKYEAAPAQAMKEDPRAADEWKLLQEALRLRGYQRKDDRKGEEEGEDVAGRTSLYYFMPGIVLSGGEDFPKDLEVTITKIGGEPTKVTVTRGDEKWEVDEKSLDKLPEDIRPHIEGMLGSERIRMGWSAKPFALESLPNWKQFKFDPQMNLKLEKKLEQLPADIGEDLRKKLEKQLGDLQKKVEQAQPAISSEVLEQLRRDLTELRRELERLHADRLKQRPQDPADDDS
jgi:hypothetical protein